MTIPHHPISIHVYRSVPLLSSYVPVKEAGALDYNPCHFYPVHLGEVFQDSYEVIAKLGYGDNSTVWLARDLLCYCFPEDRYVTLKFCCTDPLHRAATKRELTLSTCIRIVNPWHPTLKYMRTAKDVFEIAGTRCSYIKPENILLSLKSAALLDTFAADEAAQPSPCKILGDCSIYLSCNDFGPLRALPKFLRVSDFDVAMREDGNELLMHWA
ncbi:hypothetical protein NEOLEDRAFT_1183682 [Neolentinus lepideus HHB14362 ss-1]|uniref:non-specific serine/threonine protein kinase n=1 Tax=Neolentinus lepideus HHB14362 ss-1 TaxID=1314782 RepID=A0A165N328_9AGAM|nr:hypothetical protein NEOLEDRAFT_1183682 [Neolentinus lepideus HHB14362 ss-1]